MHSRALDLYDESQKTHDNRLSSKLLPQSLLYDPLSMNTLIEMASFFKNIGLLHPHKVYMERAGLITEGKKKAI
ncbi:hypothetical protein F0249_09350 [Vibrio sp. 03-59-1]|uniref:hypothetical protein n=1 Tax=Vibrio sp. 03-59-1 TaxID=2607607 RepID=UPI00149333E0|nr:hypothetical protein [Vibrio sp. 03-59-1]NOH84016.1 hypothetical protein [Vibrio sp. 03-59-1]